MSSVHETFDIHSKYSSLENSSERKSKHREKRRNVNLQLSALHITAR